MKTNRLGKLAVAGVLATTLFIAPAPNIVNAVEDVVPVSFHYDLHKTSHMFAAAPLPANIGDFNIGVVIDDKLVEFQDQVPLMDTKASRVLVPFRAIGEELGFHIEWLNETKQVKFSNLETEALLTINSLEYTINGETFLSDVAPVIINSRTMVPVRLIAEAFKCKVEWDKTLRIVYITTGKNTPSKSNFNISFSKERVDDGLLIDYEPTWIDFDENGINDCYQEGFIIRSGHPDDMPDPDSLLGGH